MYKFLQKTVGIAALIWLAAAIGISAASKVMATEASILQQGTSIIPTATQQPIPMHTELWAPVGVQERADLAADLRKDMKLRLKLAAPAGKTN